MLEMSIKYENLDEITIEETNLCQKNEDTGCSSTNLFETPKDVLQIKIKNPKRVTGVKTKSGPNPVLTDAEESTITNLMLTLAKRGFPTKKDDIKTCVQDCLAEKPRPNPFRNNRPGDVWFKAFLKRHPEIVIRTPEVVKSASASISEEYWRKWFHDIQSYLDEEQLSKVITDPSRVFNLDETTFNICPKTGLLGQKEIKNDNEIQERVPKQKITVMFTFSAAGFICKPMVIYPYKRIPTQIAESVPDGWDVERSDSGRVTATVLYDYIAYSLYPQVLKNKIKFPVILFVDGEKTHVTIKVSELCKQLKIHLIALYPNATRILQPADAAAFRPIKTAWNKILRDNPSSITKVRFASLLKSVLAEMEISNSIVNGFRVCGLFPFDENNVDYSKCLAPKTIESKEIEKGTK